MQQHIMLFDQFEFLFFEILLLLPLKLPESLISPISAIKVIAVKRPAPGSESINSILSLIELGKVSDSITVLICSNKVFIFDSIVFIKIIILSILTAKPSTGKPMILASLAALVNLEYIFSDYAMLFLELLMKILIISSLGASKIDCGVEYWLKTQLNF